MATVVLRRARGASAWVDRRPVLARWLLAGPVAFFLAVASMASLPLLLPEGRGGVDHLVMPVVLFPLIWAGAMLYPLMIEPVSRAARWMLALLAIEVAFIVSIFI